MSTLKPLFSWRGAISDSDLSPVTRHIALALSLYMSERGDSAFPGAERLAHDTALHVSTVREKLAVLVSSGWLELVEKGGTKGERRHANVYRAAIPLVLNDPSSRPTPRPHRADPSPSPRLPLAVGDPISSLISSENSSGVAVPAPNGSDPRIQSLVAGYVDDFKSERGGHEPPRDWRASAGKTVKGALNDGESVEDITVCLKVIAHESKNPATLPYVLADYHQDPNQ